MILRVAILCVFVLLFSAAYAQELFIPYGKVIFEKRVNMQRSFENMNLPNQVKETMKKYRTSNWELSFDQSRSIYKAKKIGAEQEENQSIFFSPGESSNQLYSDYSSGKRFIKKHILGDNYLLKDTIPLVKWKLLNEFREIAGYECRKALGKINDTVYVVAFYTDEILLKGGPEGFSGLPGMILGLAIPRYNTTWFATKVEAFASYSQEIAIPDKAKSIDTDKEMRKLLEVFSRYNGNKGEKPEDTKRRLYGYLL